jgi:hypothetical protein
MANSPAPAFVRINYVTAYAPHSMEVPSVPIIVDALMTSGWGFDLRGGAATVDVVDAVTALVNKLKVFHKSTTIFTDFIAYVQDDPDLPATPVLSRALGIAGTTALTGWAKAVEATWTFRTDTFGLSKIVLLDIPDEASYDKETDLSGSVIKDALADYWTADVTWVAGRDGGRPATFLQISKTLNEKLRRAYRMT